MLSVLCGVKLTDNLTETNEDLFVNNYESVLEKSQVYTFALEHFGNSLNDEDLSLTSFQTALRKRIETTQTSQFDIYSCAISALQLFVQSNWFGPLPVILNGKFNEDFNQKIKLALELDGESLLYANNYCLLLIARVLFMELFELIDGAEFADWWRLRFTYIYQQVFEEKSSTLSELSTCLMDKLMAKMNNDATNPIVLICFYLECGLNYYQIYNWTMGEVCFNKALELSNLDFKLHGVFGKRTKWQQNHLPQLILKIKKLNETLREDSLVYSNQNLRPNSIPKNVDLNDDTVLDKINFKNEDDALKTELTQLEQTVLYCILYNTRKNTSTDELTREELGAFVEYILSYPKNWCVHTSTLFERAKLESKSSRRVERSLMQLEDLSAAFKNHDPSGQNRFQFFYSVFYPSYRTLQSELANFNMQLGCINSALDIYLSLKSWDDIIKCYIVLEKREKAENIIRQELSKKETADLYCSLADCTRDVQFYHKAIEISNGRSAKAYRMLAKHLFAKENYEEAIGYFEKSLEINSMQYDAWFMLGSASFRSDKWQIAIKAFRKCTSLDPDNHETWNNLAASYIKMNEKDKAHTVFREALKLDYENWKVWENFLWTSTDCGYFDDVMRAYHRLLDLKDKYIDVDVLRILKEACLKNMKLSNDQTLFQVKNKVLELFGRISSAVVNDANVYLYYADIVFYYGTLDDCDINLNRALSNETADKAYTLLKKSLRCLMNQTNWEQAVDTSKTVIETSIEILKSCMKYGSALNDPKDVFGSFKLNFKSIINKLKQKYSANPTATQEPNEIIQLEYMPSINDSYAQLQNIYFEFLKVYF